MANHNSASTLPSTRLLFICESGTDIRMVNGLSTHFQLSLLIRQAFAGREINWPYMGENPLEIHYAAAARLRFAFHSLQWLIKNRSKYDVVLVQNYGLAALAANFARMLTHIPTLLLICSPTIEYFKCRWKKREISFIRYFITMVLLRICQLLNGLLTQHYVVLSHYLKGAVINGSRRASVIPIYGVDTTHFTPAITIDKHALRQHLSLPLDTYIIFFSSRIAAEKDTETLLMASKILASQSRKFLLLNLSGGYETFLAKAHSLGLQDYVYAEDAVHPINALPFYYQAADLCVQLSLQEGLGFSPLEAVACHIPVIASAVGGLRETIITGKTGLSVPPGNAEILAEKIAYAMDHKEEMLVQAIQGRQMVMEEFAAKDCFARLWKITTKLLKDHKH